MLERIIEEIKGARGPVTVKDLSVKLGVERSAMEGMLEYLERKGKLSVHKPADCVSDGPATCRGCVFAGACGREKKERA